MLCNVAPKHFKCEKRGDGWEAYGILGGGDTGRGSIIIIIIIIIVIIIIIINITIIISITIAFLFDGRKSFKKLPPGIFVS